MEALGCRLRKIARELGISRYTVKKMTFIGRVDSPKIFDLRRRSFEARKTKNPNGRENFKKHIACGMGKLGAGGGCIKTVFTLGL